MLTLHGRTHPVVTVRDEVLGRGGQGTVRPTVTPPDHVVKFPNDQFQVEKAEVMVAIPAPEGCRAWPLDVLSRQPGGEPEAILMERVAGVSWFEFATPAARDRAGVRVGPADLRRGIRSLWQEVAASHRVGILIPDLHPHNVLVDPAAGWAAQVIDRDSNEFEARDKNHVFRRFRCGVGLPGYLAPELVGKDLRVTDRTPASDCFAAAVLSAEGWHDGRHPFAWANPAGGPVPDITDAIRGRLWPFDPAVRPPDGCVPVDAGTPFADLPPRIRGLFHDTFTATDPARRPTADQWVNALDAWVGDADWAMAAGVIRGAVGRVARHLARMNALRMAAAAAGRPRQPSAVAPRRPTRGRGRAAVAAAAVAAAAAGGVYVGGQPGLLSRATAPQPPTDGPAPPAISTEPSDPRWRDQAVPALWRELVAEAEREGVR